MGSAKPRHAPGMHEQGGQRSAPHRPDVSRLSPVAMMDREMMTTRAARAVTWQPRADGSRRRQRDDD
ncbi:hypothetical protein BaRGS_00030246 [Batillaria attramentaria]|uniref:Uncharacterized protein n=1 Tax=Batillaria attramentaria TaxID=370345 RepID=A0ABD0JV04_9CAEN